MTRSRVWPWEGVCAVQWERSLAMRKTQLRGQSVGCLPARTGCQRKRQDLGGKRYCEPLGRRVEKKEDVSVEGTRGPWLECQSGWGWVETVGLRVVLTTIPSFPAHLSPPISPYLSSLCSHSLLRSKHPS